MKIIYYLIIFTISYIALSSQSYAVTIPKDHWWTSKSMIILSKQKENKLLTKLKGQRNKFIILHTKLISINNKLSKANKTNKDLITYQVDLQNFISEYNIIIANITIYGSTEDLKNKSKILISKGKILMNKIKDALNTIKQS